MQTVARTFVNVWIAHWGVPLHIITDHGRQFESELFAENNWFLQAMYDCIPSSNRLVEQAHWMIKTTIIARKESWLVALPIILLSICNTPNNSNFSPFFIIKATHIMISQLLIDDSSDTIENQEFAKELHKAISNIYPSNEPHKHNSYQNTYMPEKLRICW